MAVRGELCGKGGRTRTDDGQNQNLLLYQLSYPPTERWCFCSLTVLVWSKFVLFGVHDEDRTHDHRNHNPRLYRLSYVHHCLS